MPGWAQLLVVFAPWAICGMAVGYAHERDIGWLNATAVGAFVVWGTALVVLLAVGALDWDLLVG